MCGIIGYAGEGRATKVLLDGLKRLEYRGYDSAGLAIFENQKIHIEKEKGSPKALKDSISGKDFTASCGMGHTRWATHGAPNKVNSHPHISAGGKFAVIHNGIIENYVELKEELVRQGFTFLSETDTEVISNLLEYLDEGDNLKTIARVASRLQGAYALAIMCANQADTLYALKKDSPLVLGVKEKNTYLASDIAAILPNTREVFIPKDGEIARLTKEGILFFDANLKSIKKRALHVDFNSEDARMGDYKHFMLKEIFETPKAVRACLVPRIKKGEIVLDCFKDEDVTKFLKVVCIGCGSAYHVALSAKYIFEELCGIPCEYYAASEFRYSESVLDKDTLVIFISQSGETADTLAALRKVKSMGISTLSIVNVLGSSIANESERVLFTFAGSEIAVATTKAYSAQLVVIYLVAIFFARARKTISEARYSELVCALTSIAPLIERTLEGHKRAKNIAYANANAKSAFFIGRNLDYPAALEGALKLKEITYIHADCYAAGEIKHGPISLIEQGGLVVAVCGVERLHAKMLNSILEVKARGAKVLAIAQEGAQNICREAQYMLTFPKTDDIFTPILSGVVLQLFSYYTALKLKRPIDTPRNLAKSVTVE